LETIVDESLKKVVKGSGIVFFGIFIGRGIGILSRIFIIRYVTQSEYGIYSLALVMFSIFVNVSTLGLQEGTARQVSYIREKDETKTRWVINSALKISMIAGMIFSVVLFLSSDFIASNIFHSDKLVEPLKIVSLAIPFYVLILIFTSIFRGFGRVDVKVYFEDVLRSVLFVSFLVVVFIFDLELTGVIYALVASFIITFVVYTVYVTRSPIPIKVGKTLSLSPAGKELLLFSLPLLITMIFSLIRESIGILLLGFFKDPDDVGLYNGAYPLAYLLTFTLFSAGFIYVPIASQLYSKNLIGEMGRTYQIITKWIFTMSLPIFFVLFLFPDLILEFLFGEEYVSASLTLRILALSFMFNAFLGLNGPSLIVIGKTKLIMYIGFIGAVVNVVLNIILIPPYGIEGVAVASFLSYFIINILNSIKLYQLSKIQPFSRNYMKPIVNSIILLILIYIGSSFFIVKFWMLPIFLIVYLLGYFILLLLTRSLDKEDINLLLAIEKRLGTNLSRIKRIVKKFM